MAACPYGDPLCPCQDGDACHYRETKRTHAMEPPMTAGRDEVIAEIAERAAQDCVDASETLIYPSASMENTIAAAIREALSRVGVREADTARLDWLDANPNVILRSGKQHIRPLIDKAMWDAATKEG